MLREVFKLSLGLGETAGLEALFGKRFGVDVMEVDVSKVIFFCLGTVSLLQRGLEGLVSEIFETGSALGFGLVNQDVLQCGTAERRRGVCWTRGLLVGGADFISDSD